MGSGKLSTVQCAVRRWAYPLNQSIRSVLLISPHTSHAQTPWVAGYARLKWKERYEKGIVVNPIKESSLSYDSRYISKCNTPSTW